jgi:hypothetical protein
MEIFQIQATGLRAIGLLAGALVLYVIITGPRFSRTCAELDDVAKMITFDLTTQEMRHLASDTRGKSTGQLEAEFDMAKRANQLHVVITELKCADTVVLGIVCRVNYHLGTNDNASPDRQDYFSLGHSGRSVSWFDFLGPRKLLFELSWRKCTKD